MRSLGNIPIYPTCVPPNGTLLPLSEVLDCHSFEKNASTLKQCELVVQGPHGTLNMWVHGKWTQLEEFWSCERHLLSRTKVVHCVPTM